MNEEEKRELTGVLVEASLKYVYTQETLKEIEKSKTIDATRRKVENEEERRVNELLHGKSGHKCLIALYNEFEKRNLQEIGELAELIGLMQRLREKRGDRSVRDYTRYFINLFSCQMEERYEEIRRYRNFKEGLGKLSRA